MFSKQAPRPSSYVFCPSKPGSYRYYVRAIDDSGASIANAEVAIRLDVT
ncbi:MAG: hypothetical protein ACYDET_09545 [Thermoleophilia bacterium]